MVERDKKLVMITAASSALDYLKKSPNADSETVLKHVMRNMDAEGEAKIAGIAAANHVIKLKERNSRATTKQILQDLANNTDLILSSIKNEQSKEMSSL